MNMTEAQVDDFLVSLRQTLLRAEHVTIRQDQPLTTYHPSPLDPSYSAKDFGRPTGMQRTGPISIHIEVLLPNHYDPILHGSKTTP